MPLLNISWTTRFLCAKFSSGVASVAGWGNVKAVENEKEEAGLGFGEGGLRDSGMGVTVTRSSM